MKKNLAKKITSSLLVATLSATLSTSVLFAPKAEAFDVLGAVGAVVSVGAQYAYLNKQVNYLDGAGRNDMLNQAKKECGVNYDPAANAMLERIMTRLSNTIAETDPSIKKKPYNYFVNNQKTFNAFCTLGHNMSVNIGLFEILNYNEDEIAFVVGHEMGHGQRNDPANGVKGKMPIAVLAALYQSQNPNAVSVISSSILSNIGSAKGVTLPAEKRADRSAFEYCSKAGYNVGAGAAVWERVLEKMGESKEGFVSEIFNPSDHPGNISRRDLYSKDITTWSNNAVTVNKDTGMISVNKKEIGVPAALKNMSAKERAYLAAGKLAGVYHHKTLAKTAIAEQRGDIIYFGNEDILTVTSGDDGNAWVTKLNAANKKK